MRSRQRYSTGDFERHIKASERQVTSAVLLQGHPNARKIDAVGKLFCKDADDPGSAAEAEEQLREIHGRI